MLVVPGGGPFADAVRQLDAVHALGEEQSHWLALRALGVAAEFVKAVALRPEDSASRLSVVDALAFAAGDEALPHSWAVTSDSLAARVAVVNRAERLILLKSIDVPPDTPWPVAAANGWVDAHFPQVAATATFAIHVLNFRRWLDRFSRPA